MCYTGGPYCARVASAKVAKAENDYSQNPSYANYQNLKETKTDYYGTREGQKVLEQEILKTTDPSKRNELLSMKESSSAKRKKEVTAAVARENMKKSKERYTDFVKSDTFQATRYKLDNNIPPTVQDMNTISRFNELKNDFESSRQEVIRTNRGIDRKKDVNEKNDVPVYDDNGYDQHGYDRNGFDEEGYDREGYDKWGWDKDKFDREGYDQEGWDGFGFSRHGLHKDHFKEDSPYDDITP